GDGDDGKGDGDDGKGDGDDESEDGTYIGDDGDDGDNSGGGSNGVALRNDSKVGHDTKMIRDMMDDAHAKEIQEFYKHTSTDVKKW
ncbi:hypothetical protein BGX30_004274, partial [Mortierella sp. GBA39]